MNRVVNCYGFGGDQGVLAKVIELTKRGYTIDLHKSHSTGFNNYILFTEEAVVDEVPEEEEVVEAPEETSEKVEEESTEEVLKVNETIEEEHKEDVSEVLASLTKKKELLAFAKERGMSVPEDLKAPPTIKKWIKDNL